MKFTQFLIGAIGGLMGMVEGQSATITWDGEGGDFSWQNATNWSLNSLPGVTDDVVINVPGNITVTSSANVTILSLQCSNNFALSAGTFRLRSGASVVQGQFSTTGNPTLSATGALTSFSVAGPVTSDGASFEALNATISLPRMNAFSKGAGCAFVTWSANGGNAVLSLPGLTNIAGATCANLTIQALAGGHVSLPSLADTTEGYTTILADGMGSLVNLPVITRSSGSMTRTVTFEARNKGTISLPQFTSGSNAIVTIKTGGVLDVAQLTELNGFNVTGTNVVFPSLTNLTAGNIVVDGGAVVTASNLSSHDHGGSCATGTWRVTGAGSVLDFSNLMTLTGPGCGWLNVQATGGGTFDLSGLTTVTEGTLYFLADGTNSLLDLPSLDQVPAVSRGVSFEARNNGTMWVPLLTHGENVVVILQPGGVLPVAQLKQLHGFTVNGMSVSFPGLTNLTDGNVTVSGGASVNAPNLTTHYHAESCAANTWLVTGAGSVLDFSNLKILAGPNCGWLNVNATAGGSFNLSGLTNVVEGTLYFLADGTGSLLDLTALRQSSATLRAVNLTARNNGTLAVPLLEGGPTLTVTIQSGGALDAAQMTLLKGLIISGTSLTLPGITNLFAGDLTVDQGGVLSFPNLFSHNQGTGCNVNSWSVSGPGSVLDLSSLTNLIGSSCGGLEIKALAGGTAVLTNLPVIADGTLTILADGTNSRVGLDALRQSLATSRAVTLEVRNAGTIAMPQMTGGPTVSVIIKTNGMMPVAQFTRLSSIVVSATNANFTGLTNLDAGAFSVSNAAMVTAPNLTTFNRGGACSQKPWLVTGSNSVLNLSGIRFLTGGTCDALNAQALGGGQLRLGNLGSITFGAVSFLASGSNSVIDLHSLSNCLNAANLLSQLRTTNGGSILLPSPLFLSGTTVNIGVGTPGLSPVNLTGTNLVLHGNAWRGYWTETRDTASPANPWQFLKRVPLTNDFQIIGPRAVANREFRGWEFVADPFHFDLTVLPGSHILPVLYGPANQAFEVVTTTNLASPVVWEAYGSVTMTNTFRLFPNEPVTTPQRYFKVTPL